MDQELHYRSATELSRLLRAGELSAVELVTACLDRIERVNAALNAVITLTADSALEQAGHADRAFARGEWVGPLHGLPTAHKDNHLTAGLRTTFGSPIFADHVPTVDHLVIERMKRAGVITLGKTNLPELAAGGHTFNQLFGITRNPYDPSVTAGGSSGGAAVGLATGMFPIADGTDMGGSLRLPAGYCNVIGLRSTPGRIPDHPAPDAFLGLSVSGPMARCVDDIALLLSVMAGPDRRSPLSLEEPGRSFAVVPEGGLAGRRVAFSADLGGEVAVTPDVRESVQRAARACADAGAEVVEACPDFSGADECFRVLRAWHFEATLGGLLEQHRETVRPSLYENMAQGRSLSGPDVGRAVLHRTVLFARMREFLTEFDALVLPISPLPAFDADLQFPAEVAGEPQPDYLGWMRAVCALTLTAHPVIAMPAGLSAAGTPLGVQIVGRHRAERDLLGMAKGYETASRFADRHPTLDFLSDD